MEKSEYIFRCKICKGEVHAQAKSKEEVETWLDQQFGICPAGGNHVELGLKRDYLELVRVSDELSHIPTKKEILSELLEKVEARKPILMVGLEHPDIPTIHNFCSKEVHQTVNHCGLGFFEGHTKHGTFSFDAGGAMRHHRFEDGTWLSVTPLRVDNEEVLRDLTYDFAKVEQALKEVLEGCT